VRTDGPFFAYTLHEPIGIVGAIVPWNFPIIMVGTTAMGVLCVACDDCFLIVGISCSHPHMRCCVWLPAQPLHQDFGCTRHSDSMSGFVLHMLCFWLSHKLGGYVPHQGVQSCILARTAG
jgi:Aldehyde dehydrogenase family